MYPFRSLNYGLLYCLLAIVASVHGDQSQVDVESLAQVVCTTTRGTKNQITNVHQIFELIQFLQPLTSASKLFPCRNVYLESIEDLERVLSVGNDDACGEQKIKLLEDFHRKYVSKLTKHLHEQKRANKAPKMIKLFFMQYASKISSICEQSAVSFLESRQQAITGEELAKLEELGRFTDVLGMNDISNGYKGVYLFWNMIDSLSYSAEKKFAKYLASGRARINIQMKDGAPLRYLQALCRFKLHPIYSRSVLPVLRLVDMGYYPVSTRLLSEDPKLRSMFYATQVCETLLPVQVYDDDKLAKDQFVALTLDDAAKLEPAKEIEGWKIEEVHVEPKSTAHLDSLISEADEARADLEMIKENVATRSKVITRMMKTVFKQMKTRLGKMGKLLFKRGASQQLEAIDTQELSKIDEHMVQIPENNDDGEGSRVRRSLFKMAMVGGILVYFIYFVILTVVKVAILLIPTILHSLTGRSQSEREFNPNAFDKALGWAWSFDPLESILELKKE